MISIQLIIATNCPHCANNIKVLTELLKSAEIAELNIKNLEQFPELSSQLNIRSIPWTKIGPFELTGALSKTEVKNWVEKVSSPSGMQAYFSELFTSGELDKALELVKKSPELLQHFPVMMADESTPLGAKIGIGAIFESLQGTQSLLPLIPQLADLTQSDNASIRHDACYYLGLTESPEVVPYIKPLIDDTDLDIKETAEEILEALTLEK